MAILFATTNLRIVRGNAWSDDVALVKASDSTPVDLADIVALHMRVREEPSGPALLTLSTTDNTLIIGAPATGGTFGVRVDSATTRTLPDNGHEVAVYVYDVVIERTAGEYEAATGGVLIVDPQITRPWET